MRRARYVKGLVVGFVETSAFMLMPRRRNMKVSWMVHRGMRMPLRQGVGWEWFDCINFSVNGVFVGER